MRRKLSALLLVLLLGLELVTPAQAAKLLAITFDDGPSPVYTPQVLEELDKRDVKATFFLVGKWLPGKRDLIRQMMSEGHQIASHTYDHARLSELPPEGVREQIEKNRAALEEFTGLTDFKVRTPFGVRDSQTLENIDAPVILWSIDPAGGRQVPGDQMAKKVIAQAKDGDIILLHDTTQYNLDAVGAVLDALRAKGFDFVTVDELFRLRGISLQNGKIYKRAPAAADPQAYDENRLSRHWAWRDIQYMEKRGLMTGDGEGWHPNQYLSRAMAATVLWRAWGSPVGDGAADFSDVQPGQWYSEAAAWAASRGVIRGKTADCFDPNGVVTRQELYVILARLARSQGDRLPEEAAETPRYADSFRVGSWAQKDVQFLEKLGFASANDVELFRPEDPATRAETAELLHWFLTRTESGA